MLSNVSVTAVETSAAKTFIPHFGLPLLGGAKFTPKVGFKAMDLEKAEKLLRGSVPNTLVTGSINESGYAVFGYSVNGVEVGTISFYPSELDELSTEEEVAAVTAELVEKLKTTRITQAVEDGSAMMQDW